MIYELGFEKKTFCSIMFFFLHKAEKSHVPVISPVLTTRIESVYLHNICFSSFVLCIISSLVVPKCLLCYHHLFAKLFAFANTPTPHLHNRKLVPTFVLSLFFFLVAPSSDKRFEVF